LACPPLYFIRRRRWDLVVLYCLMYALLLAPIASLVTGGEPLGALLLVAIVGAVGLGHAHYDATAPRPAAGTRTPPHPGGPHHARSSWRPWRSYRWRWSAPGTPWRRVASRKRAGTPNGSSSRRCATGEPKDK